MRRGADLHIWAMFFKFAENYIYMKISKSVRLYRLIAAVMLFIGVAAPASAEFRWGPTAGVNFSNFHFKQKLIDTDMAVGPNAGLMGEIMIPGIGFGVDFALKYNMHGANVHFGQKEVWASDGYGTEKVRLHTLEVPVNLRFKWTRMNGLENYIAPLAYVGPVFNFTLGHSDVKALEYPGACVGVQCGLGVELMRRLQISAGYYWGLTYEIRTVKLDNFSAQPRSWVVNAAWLF